MRSISNLVSAIWETASSAPPDELRVSEFEESVLSVLRSLRWGEIHTYGEVAEMAGFPGRARGVGRILSITGEDVPWWRVVGHGGKLVSPHADEQAARLRAEGIVLT